MFCLNKTFQRLIIVNLKNVPKISARCKTKFVATPVIGHGISFRRKVHFPEEYTVKPLDVTNLAGRDPETGRMVVKGIGGGIKHKYHWIDWKRVGPKEGPPQVERVIKIIKDGCRTAYIALVAYEDKLKYILATQNMKPGDQIKTSCHIPRIPVRANEGDAYPLGALPLGTQVHCVEKYPGLGGFLVHAAGTYATITRKAPNNHVIIMMPSKKEFCFPKEEIKKKAWMKIVNRTNFEPTTNSFLCSEHFSEDSFDRTSCLKVRLRLTAVPTFHVDRLKNVGGKEKQADLEEKLGKLHQLEQYLQKKMQRLKKLYLPVLVRLLRR